MGELILGLGVVRRGLREVFEDFLHGSGGGNCVTFGF